MYFMIFVLSFLVPGAIVSGPIMVSYIETEERIQAESARAIAGYSADMIEPRKFGLRTWFKSSTSWPNWDILDILLNLMQNRRQCTVWERTIDRCKPKNPPNSFAGGYLDE